MAMIKVGDVVSYMDMCQEEGAALQRGMNYRLGKAYSIVLMSVRVGAPYADKVKEEGSVLIYEGHDVSRTSDNPIPKMVDQPLTLPSGKLTQNGLFFQAAKGYKRKQRDPERVKVYEKVNTGIWVYNGLFQLVDAWLEEVSAGDGIRNVCKYKLELSDDDDVQHNEDSRVGIEHDRIIPAPVKLEVWKRDKGRCVMCESKENLHFDHIIPYSRGGSSLTSKNIQLLCMSHNLAKRDKIE